MKSLKYNYINGVPFLSTAERNNTSIQDFQLDKSSSIASIAKKSIIIETYTTRL